MLRRLTDWIDECQGAEASGSVRIAAALSLIVLTVVAYLPALHAGFVWDDDLYVHANPTLRTLDGLRRIWLEPGASPQYYPLTFTTFWLEYQLWGANPAGYHVVNVLLHGLDAALLWWLLRELQIPGAWVAAAIFAVHPIQVESVAWITERKNVLSALFAFAAAGLYLKDPGRNERQSGDRVGWKRGIAVWGLYACALWSKSLTCTLPLVLLLMTWWRHGRIGRRDWSSLAPMVALGVALGSVTVWAEQRYVSAQGNDWSLSLLERALVAGRIFWFYPASLLWPRSLSFMYPRWSVDAVAWRQYLFPVAAGGLIALLWFGRARLGRGPLVAVLVYAVTLAPAMGFLDVYAMRYSFVADHFAYLPMIALTVLGTSSCVAVATRAGVFRGRREWLGRGLAGAGLAFLALLTARQSRMYHDLPTLWRVTLARNPDCWMAHNNLATYLLNGSLPEVVARGGAGAARAVVEEAVAHLEAAVRIKSDYPEPYYNLGVARTKAGRFTDAIPYLEHAIRLRPDYLQAHAGLAEVLLQTGQVARAVQQYELVLRFNPEDGQAHYDLAAALVRAGDLERGIEHYEAAVRFAPDHVGAHYGLGRALLEAQETDKAAAEFRETLRLDPNHAEAHNDLGGVLSVAGRRTEATAEYEHALQLKPDFAEAHLNLGSALLQEGRHTEAIAHLRQALRIRPDMAGAHGVLGVALGQSGNLNEAIRHLEEAVRLQPDDAGARSNLAELLTMRAASGAAEAHSP